MGFSSLGKKYKLKRSGVEYSEAEPFYEVIEKIELREDVILDVLDLVEEKFDNYDGDNSDRVYRILSVIKKFPDYKVLFLKEVYYHLLRLSVIPKITTNESLKRLSEAYRDINNKLDKKYPYISIQKLETLFLFGYYSNIKIDDSLTIDIDIFNKRRKVVLQCSKYSNIPSMLKKKEQFLSFCDDETSERLYILIIKIPHNDESLELIFWAYVFITLLNSTTKSKIIEYFENLEDTDHIKEKEIFKRFVAIS